MTGGYLFTELGFRVGFSSWIFELDFRVGFSSWISSWIFELGFFWRDFLAGFFRGCPINFQWFYTTYFVSGVAHRGLKRIADR